MVLTCEIKQTQKQVSVYSGITIIDVTTNIAGSYATMFLADHGAEVIKVEPIEGDPMRSDPGFQTLNRGKKSFVLGVPKFSEHPYFSTLIKYADVFVIDATPKKAEKLGLDYESIQKINPKIIYLHVPPYGTRGPLVDRPYSPTLLSAVTGMMAHQISYSGDPTYIVLPLGTYATGILAAAGVATALFARSKWNVGQKVEVSELAGSMALLMGADRKFANPHPMGSKGPIPVYRLYRTGDDKWFFLACANKQFFEKLMRCIGREELIHDPRLKDAWVFSNQIQSIRDILVPILEQTFASNTQEYWVNLLNEADIPAQPVLSRDDFFASDFVKENNLNVSVVHRKYGKIDMMGIPLIMEKTPGRVSGPAPMLGEHNIAIQDIIADLQAKEFDEIWTPENEIISHKLPANGPLSGIKVLDLSAYIAGPVGTRHLCSLGADVLKIEPLHGDAFRSHSGFPDFNQGKKSIALNLQHPAGREIFYKLVKSADLVVENFRPDVARRLLVDYETVKHINPAIIYASLPGYGIYEKMRKAPAFDPLLQSLSGSALNQGGGKVPCLHTIPLNDVTTPCVYNFAVLSALYYRQQTGVGQKIIVSLLHSSLANQAREYTRYKGVTQSSFVRGGIDFVGPSDYCRWYSTKDSKRILVEANTPQQQESLFVIAGVAKPEELPAQFATKTLSEWMELLDSNFIPAIPMGNIGSFWDAEFMLENDLLVKRQDNTTAVGPLIKFSGMPSKVAHFAPKLSENCIDVLEQVGLSSEEQFELKEMGVCLL